MVYRPEDPADFDGTVVVEWLNVSSGFDVAVDWSGAHTQMIATTMAQTAALITRRPAGAQVRSR